MHLSRGVDNVEALTGPLPVQKPDKKKIKNLLPFKNPQKPALKETSQASFQALLPSEAEIFQVTSFPKVTFYGSFNEINSSISESGSAD